MKNKNIIKILICLMLSCSLCVSAPLARFQRIETHAAIAVPVVLAGAALVVAVAAACGVSYIFSGMSSAEAKEWIDTKIIEFEQYKGSSMPSTGGNNTKWQPNGKLIVAAVVVNYIKEMLQWIISDQQAGTFKELYNQSYYPFTDGSFKIYEINISPGSLYDYIREHYPTRTSLPYDFIYIDSFIPGSEVNDTKTFYFDENNTSGFHLVFTKASDYSYQMQCLGVPRTTTQVIQSINFPGYPNNVIQNSDLSFGFFRNLGASGSDINQIILVQWRSGLNGALDIRSLGNINWTGLDYEESSVDQYLDDDSALPSDLSEGEGLELDDPEGGGYVNYDSDNVPTPKTNPEIWEDIWERVSSNSSSGIVYNPTYNVVNNYNEYVNVNTEDYDEPYEEPTPEPEPQPDWSGMSAGDVPAFTQSVWNYFLQNHSWNQLKQKFPFSLPYDAYLIANIFFDTSYDVMDELPTDSGSNRRLVKASNAPVYRFAIPKWDGTTYELVLDFSLIDPWQPIIRAAVGVLFTVGLIVGVL